MKAITLFKSLEAIFIIAFAVIMYVFKFKFGLIPGSILVGGYVALNLTGYAVKTLREAKDAIKK